MSDIHNGRKEFGAEVRRARGERSQLEIAGEARVSQTSLSDMERGIVVPSLATALRVLDALRIPDAEQLRLLRLMAAE